MVLLYTPMGHPKFHENYQLVQKLKWMKHSMVTSSVHFLLFLGQWTKIIHNSSCPSINL